MHKFTGYVHDYYCYWGGILSKGGQFRPLFFRRRPPLASLWEARGF